jgi:Zn-finger nucleic acid-binding protein
MKCPIDGENLKVQNYEAGIQVDACSCCGGVWLDRGELEAIQKTIERDYSKILTELDREKILHEVAGAKVSNFSTDAILLDNTDLPPEVDRSPCPKCNASMIKSFYRPDNATVIDICPNGHGLWLDAGELQKLEVFYQGERFFSGEEKDPKCGKMPLCLNLSK